MWPTGVTSAGPPFTRLADYGEASRWTLPDLYADLAWWKHDENYNTLVSTVAALEAATTTPALIYALPKADPQILATPANTPKALTLTGSSCRTNPVTYTVATQPAHGTLTGIAAEPDLYPRGELSGHGSFHVHGHRQPDHFIARNGEHGRGHRRHRLDRQLL